uniref:Cystatin domain-containing protein n=1 Tax=Oryzias sinensis TaxID=183150 RepID=A0A8C7ZBN8_9TELE
MWRCVFLAALFAVGFGFMTGGLTDIDSHDAAVLGALKYAVQTHNNRSNDMYVSQVTEVIRAQSQVVTGVNYIITVKMARTSCRKGRDNEVCSALTDPQLAQSYQCTFTVWERSWLKDIRVLKEKCG